MEIFRIDGGGRNQNPPRLIKVLGKVMTRIPDTSNVWNNVKAITDEKGALTILLYNHFINSMDETFMLYLFMKEWDSIGEDSNFVFVKYEEANNDL